MALFPHVPPSLPQLGRPETCALADGWLARYAAVGMPRSCRRVGNTSADGPGLQTAGRGCYTLDGGIYVYVPWRIL